MSETVVFFVECDDLQEGLVLELSREENTDIIIEKARENFGLPQKIKLDLWLQLTASPKFYYVPECVSIKGLRFSDPIRAHIRRSVPKESNTGKSKPKESKVVKQEQAVSKTKPKKPPPAARRKAKDVADTVDLNTSARSPGAVQETDAPGANGPSKPVQPAGQASKSIPRTKVGKKRPSKAADETETVLTPTQGDEETTVAVEDSKPAKKRKGKNKPDIPMSQELSNAVHEVVDKSVTLNQTPARKAGSSRLRKMQAPVSSHPIGTKEVAANGSPTRSGSATNSESEQEKGTAVGGNEEKAKVDALQKGQNRGEESAVSDSGSSSDSESDSDSTKQNRSALKQIAKKNTLQELLDQAAGTKANGMGHK